MKEDRGLQLEPLLKPRSFLSRDWFSNETLQCVTCKIHLKAFKTAAILCFIICFKFGKFPVGQTQMITLKTTAKYSHVS